VLLTPAGRVPSDTQGRTATLAPREDRSDVGFAGVRPGKVSSRMHLSPKDRIPHRDPSVPLHCRRMMRAARFFAMFVDPGWRAGLFPPLLADWSLNVLQMFEV
jgi:hypothetical protein